MLSPIARLTTTEMAARLTGREYPFQLTKEEAAQASAARIVIVYGASDDLMEFEGAINDEIGCYGGGTAYLAESGLLKNDCENDECPHFSQLKQQAPTIKALWCAEPSYSWTFETEIPHKTFEIVEQGEPYCRGIVFELSHVAHSDRGRAIATAKDSAGRSDSSPGQPVCRERLVIPTKKRELERSEFEFDAKQYGFSVQRHEHAAPEPWGEYASEATGHRWAGWLAARGLA